MSALRKLNILVNIPREKIYVNILTNPFRPFARKNFVPKTTPTSIFSPSPPVVLRI